MVCAVGVVFPVLVILYGVISWLDKRRLLNRTSQAFSDSILALTGRDSSGSFPYPRQFTQEELLADARNRYAIGLDTFEQMERRVDQILRGS